METSQDPVEVSPGSGVGHLVDPNSGSKMDCTPSLEPGVENLREACDVRVPDAAVVVGDAAAASQGSLEPTPLASDASNVLAFRPQLVLNIPSHVLGPAVTVGDSQNSLNPSPPPAPDASNIPVSSIPGFVDDLIDTYRNASLGNSDGLILHSHPPTTLMTTASVQGEQPMGSSPDASSANLLFGGYGSALSFPVITWPSGQLITGCPTSVLQENGMSSTNGGFDHRYQSGPYIHVPQNEGLNMLRIPCAPMPPGMAYARFPISDCGGPYDPMRLGVGATPMGARTTSLESSDQAPSTLSSPQSLSEQSATLGALNVMGLNYKRTVFFFFVLALQNGLEPRIEFRNYFDSKWVVRLTLVGEKLEPQQSFDTKFAAKAHVCREGLLALKVRYPNWVLPKVPRVDLVGDTWSWSAILQAYCDLENLPLPKYVGHPHSHGDRYEVKVCGTSFHGLRKFYPSVTEAIHGCAHNALYCILVSKAPLEAQEELAPKPPQNKLTKGAVSLTDTSPGGTKKRKAKNSAAKVPAGIGSKEGADRTCKVDTKLSSKASSTITKVQKMPAKAPNSGADVLVLSGKARRRLARKYRKEKEALAIDEMCTRLGLPKNPNLTSLRANRQFGTPVPEAVRNQTRSPKLTAIMIKEQLNRWSTYVEKLEKICQLMGIHTPELRVTQTLDDFRNDQASAAAYFDGDPYFARVGAIGIVQAVRPKELAKEACAAKTVEFLIKTVEDDESRGVDENTKQRNSEFQVKLWEERAELAKVSQRLLDDAPAFMPMDEEYVEII